MKPNKISNVSGIILILLGLILTYQSVFNPFDIYISNLQLLILFVGLVVIFISKKAFLGLLIIYIDLAFIYSNKNNFTLIDVLFEYWPILMILFGLSLIIDIYFSKHKQKSNNLRNKSVEYISGKENIEETVILNYRKLLIDAGQLSKIKITSFFAGAEIDFENLDLSKPLKFEVIVFFSGLKLHVPANIKINLEVTPLFGGVADKRIRVSATNQKPNILTIKGTTAFGGIEIYN
ncbi:MAG: hypothetical protein V1773_19860 [bacterium]